ncbi:T9SS type A sorting domain-containing protein [Sporocytophaga myxococcoides]|uniref:T9SS type A sorting domain-containing protein n=1 Tax=Sporocytophaga myxococcoides TaxID=153721 RepID=UPI000420DC6B|nr:T9SS type A sorting domain-containing protein [Sporocytophaga myxococcoides]
MRKQLLLIALLLASLNLSAQQIENSNFENWVFDDNTGRKKPGGNWMASLSCFDPDEVCSGLLLRDDDGKTGFGAHILGRGVLKYNAAFDAKPSKLSFWYKGNGGRVYVKIISMGAYEPINDSDIIGSGVSTLADAESFTNIEIPISYENTGQVKSILIEFSGQDNSDFSFDEIELIYEVNGIADLRITKILGSNIVTSSLILKDKVDELCIYNTSGRVVLSATETQAADISNLPEGLYILTLRKDSAIGTIKVIKN